ncbi:MAG: hypothetical protein AAGD01_20250 [Acidobacteriota bacterium]
MKRRKSKKRSDTTSPPEPTFFCDENLGRLVFPGRLREAGVRVEIFADHFPLGTKDQDWLRAIAGKEWLLLTLDARIRYNRLEQLALLESGIGAFVLVGGKDHKRVAESFLKAMHRVLRFAEKHPKPWIAKVYRDGKVKPWLSGEESGR